MSRDLTVAWELLTAIAVVQQRLATVRPFIWERTRLATAEHTLIVRANVDGDTWRPSDEGDHVVVEVSVETRLPDGRTVGSYIEIVAGREHWRVHPYIGVDGGVETLWELPAAERDEVTAFLESVELASRHLVSATIRVDFDRFKTSSAES